MRVILVNSTLNRSLPIIQYIPLKIQAKAEAREMQSLKIFHKFLMMKITKKKWKKKKRKRR